MLELSMKYQDTIFTSPFETKEKLQFMMPTIINDLFTGAEIINVIDSELGVDVWPELKSSIDLAPKAKSTKSNILVPSNSEFDFKLGGSKLIYNTNSERLEVLEEDGNTISLHCGNLIDIYLDGKWETHRVEMHESWYIVNLFGEYQIPDNLLVSYSRRENKENKKTSSKNKSVGVVLREFVAVNERIEATIEEMEQMVAKATKDSKKEAL